MANLVIIVLDGMGVGALPDADRYGDAGSDTLGHTAAAVGGLRLPVLARLGLGNIHAIAGVPPSPQPAAGWGRLREVSAGKDSTTGHWELMGVRVSEPFPVYPQGFPPEVLDAFRAATGYGWLGNVAASGTEILQRLGDEHVATGKPIIYTSADSVFQVAAHEEVVPPAELYRICQVSRRVLVSPHQVSRVIARPFTGTSGHYERTAGRRDFSVEPPDELVLPRLVACGVEVVAIGKISDLYAGKGITRRIDAHGNAEGMAALVEAYADHGPGPTLFLLNLVDFDMLWGHRNDPHGLAAGLAVFDTWLDTFLVCLRGEDLLLITADHGNDPTTRSTDHSREYAPLLVVSGRGRGAALGTRETFADVAASVAEFFGVSAPAFGTSFLSELAGGGEEGPA